MENLKRNEYIINILKNYLTFDLINIIIDYDEFFTKQKLLDTINIPGENKYNTAKIALLDENIYIPHYNICPEISINAKELSVYNLKTENFNYFGKRINNDVTENDLSHQKILAIEEYGGRLYILDLNKIKICDSKLNTLYRIYLIDKIGKVFDIHVHNNNIYCISLDNNMISMDLYGNNIKYICQVDSGAGFYVYDNELYVCDTKTNNMKIYSIFNHRLLRTYNIKNLNLGYFVKMIIKDSIIHLNNGNKIIFLYQNMKIHKTLTYQNSVNYNYGFEISGDKIYIIDNNRILIYQQY